MLAQLVAKLLLELLVVLAAFIDLRSRRIPNWLTASGVVMGLSTNAYQGHWTGLKEGLLGMLLAFAIYTLLFALRAMSAGDVKLMAAVGAFVGPLPWLLIFVVTAFVWVLILMITLLRHGGLARLLTNVAAILGSLAHFQAPHKNRPDLDVAHPSARTLPHGASIAVGVLIYLLWLAPPGTPIS